MKLSIYKSDTLGVFAGIFCVVHCLATPILFMTQTTIVSHDAAPVWWQNIDYIFLVISFFAVYRSTQKSSKLFIKIGLWVTFTALAIIIINEKMEWVSLSEILIYIVTLVLIILHLCNLSYCQCKTKHCCINSEHI